MADRPIRMIPIHPAYPGDAELELAANVLRAGGLVAFPTETVYGLGANAFDPAAVHRIFEAKGRPSTNPLIVHVSDEAMLKRVVANWPEMAQRLAGQFWPGPLTFVLPKTSAIPDVVTGGGPTVAVRMPQHPVALGLIRTAGVPLAAPSANRSAELSPTRAEHVLAGLSGRIDLILDGGPTATGIESTVLDLTCDPPDLLRPGPISIAALEAVVGHVGRREKAFASGPLPSPGMMPRHYAPKTAVELFKTREQLQKRETDLRNAGELIASVVLGAEPPPLQSGVAMPADPMEYAARLYEVLHELDRQGLSRILIELPSDRDEWLAVRDRLLRATR